MPNNPPDGAVAPRLQGTRWRTLAAQNHYMHAKAMQAITKPVRPRRRAFGPDPAIPTSRIISREHGRLSWQNGNAPAVNVWYPVQVTINADTGITRIAVAR